MVSNSTRSFGSLRRRPPVRWSKDRQVVLVGHGRQPGQDVAQIGVGGVAEALAGNDDRVDDGGTLAGLGMSDEEPVFLSNRRGSDGVFNGVVIQTGPAVRAMGDEDLPITEQIPRPVISLDIAWQGVRNDVQGVTGHSFGSRHLSPS
jgi:hypothetical protein